MTEIRNVLCPVDFSEFSRHAMTHALAIARWYDAQVTALHVIPPIASLIPSGDAVGLYPPVVFTPDDLRQFEAELEAFIRDCGGDESVHAVVAQGSITGEILRAAEGTRADLIVIGTHGRSGFDRLMLGSVTEKMLRKAACPVLTVPRGAPDAVPSPVLFTRILCAVDFSPASLKALSFAESLAKEADASLTLVHVLEPASVLEPVAMGGAPSSEGDGRNAARRHLAEVVSPDARTFSHVSEVVVSGKPYRVLLREASERRADLIVLGAHGGRIGLTAFGSTTNQVVRQAHCPVLILPA